MLSLVLLLVAMLPVKAMAAPKMTWLAVQSLQAAYGEAVVLKAWLRWDKSNDSDNYLSERTVTFKVNGAVVGTAVTNPTGARHNKVELHGEAALNYTVSLPPGRYALEAAFSGDSKYGPSGALGVLEVTGMPKTLTTLSTVNYAALPGGTVTLRAWLKDRTTGAALQGLPVEFAVGGTPAGVAMTDSSGLAELAYTASLALGSYPVSASFAGDDTYATSGAAGTLEVQPLPREATTMAITSLAANQNSPVRLYARLTGQDGAGIAGRTVTFYVNGSLHNTGETDDTGLAWVNYPVLYGAGVYPIGAEFAGDDSYLPSSGSGTLTVVVAVPTSLALSDAQGYPGDTVMLRAYLQAGSQYASGRTITFLVDGVVVGTAVTNANGSETNPSSYHYGKAELAYQINVGPGVHVLQAVYAGDPYFSPTSQTTTLTVY